jgi:hypothetical protein
MAIVKWTPLNQLPTLNNNSAYASAMWLMQDGSILVNLYGSTQLMFLRPDKSGSYINGSWTLAGNFLLQKWSFSSAVLSDGRLVACGGEYAGPGLPQRESNFCEAYDPRTMVPAQLEPLPSMQSASWYPFTCAGTKVATQFEAPPNWPHIGDGPTAVLNDGTVILGNTQGLGQQLALLDPSNLSWTFGGGDSDNEQGYVLMQTGDVLTVGVTPVVVNGTPVDQSQRYDPGANAFVPDSSLPNGVILRGGHEIGPGISLMNGDVIWFGATGSTCLYSPGAEGQNGNWLQGPNLADGNGNACFAIDTPAILEPNGSVLVLTKGPIKPVFIEYDPVPNENTPDTTAPFAGAYEYCRMLLLPNGHGLVSLSTAQWFDVEFSAGAKSSWAPSITSFPRIVTPNSKAILAGTQLCGLSECSTYGDDNQQSEHYPMVRFVDSDSNVTYALAHDVSTRSIAPGKPGTVVVEIPGSLKPGTYTLNAVAMGIPSSGVEVDVVPGSDLLKGCVGDMDGDGIDEILVSSPWGIGLLKRSGDTMTSLALAASGTRVGPWLLDTSNNQFGPVADFDSDGRDEVLVISPWGIGLLKYESGKLTAVSLTPDGTDLGGVKLNTFTDQFGPVLSLESDSIRLFYTTPAGVALISLANPLCSLDSVFYYYGTTLGDGVNWALETDSQFGPIGDFDGDGINEILVASRAALGLIKLGSEWDVIVNVPNGATLTGGWKIDTSNNLFQLVGNNPGRGSSQAFILATSPWGIGLLQCVPASAGTPTSLASFGLAANDTDLGGWKLDTSVDKFGPSWRASSVADLQVLVTGPSGIAILGAPGPQGSSSLIHAVALAANGTSLGGWQLETANNRFGSLGAYDGAGQTEILATSPWGIGILRPSGSTFAATMMQPNGTRLGGWILDTTSNSL